LTGYFESGFCREQFGNCAPCRARRAGSERHGSNLRPDYPLGPGRS